MLMAAVSKTCPYLLCIQSTTVSTESHHSKFLESQGFPTFVVLVAPHGGNLLFSAQSQNACCCDEEQPEPKSWRNFDFADNFELSDLPIATLRHVHCSMPVRASPVARLPSPHLSRHVYVHASTHVYAHARYMLGYSYTTARTRRRHCLPSCTARSRRERATRHRVARCWQGLHRTAPSAAMASLLHTRPCAYCTHAARSHMP